MIEPEIVENAFCATSATGREQRGHRSEPRGSRERTATEVRVQHGTDFRLKSTTTDIRTATGVQPRRSDRTPTDGRHRRPRALQRRRRIVRDIGFADEAFGIDHRNPSSQYLQAHQQDRSARHGRPSAARVSGRRRGLVSGRGRCRCEVPGYRRGGPDPQHGGRGWDRR